MDTEAEQFTLEGNEVVHIANLDTNAAAETAAHAAAVIQQVEVMQQQENHQAIVAVPQDADNREVGSVDMVVPQVTDNKEVGDISILHSEIENTGEAKVEQQQIVHEEQHEIHQEPTWHSYFRELQSHETTYSTLDVDVQTNPALAAWIDEQRRLYQLWKSGHKEELSGERILLLDSLGFDFEGTNEPNYGNQVEAVTAAANSNLSGSEQDVKTFHLRLTQLEQYKATHGHPNIPETYKEDPALGRWIAQQRAAYRKQTLPQDKIDAMTDLGFDFTPGDRKVPFEARLEQLKSYKSIHGDVKIPRRYAENPGLGEWLHSQKKLYRRWENDQKGGMNEPRRKALLDIGVDFSTDPIKGDADNADSTTNTSAVYNINTGLAAEETQNRSSKWDEKFHELQEFKLANGHCNVPRRSKRNPSFDALGEWVHFQRRQYRNLLNGKNSTLTIARKKALELLEFQWYRAGGSLHHHGHQHDDPAHTMTVRDALQVQILKAHEEGKKAPWEDRFAQLTEYMHRFGNADVPINYAENLSLGAWVHRQRVACKVWKEQVEPKQEEMNETGEQETIVEVKEEIAAQEAQEVSGEDTEKQVIGEHEEEQVSVEVPQEQAKESSTDIQEVTAETEKGGENSAIESNFVEDNLVVPIAGADTMPVIPTPEDVDKMTPEHYEKLAAIGFDFEVKAFPEDFNLNDGQEPATLILSKTAEEEEVPVIEDEQDVLEINLGEEEESDNAATLPMPSIAAKPDMELNEMEVSAILDGHDEAPSGPQVEAPIPVIAQTDQDMHTQNGETPDQIHVDAQTEEHGQQEMNMQNEEASFAVVETKELEQKETVVENDVTTTLAKTEGHEEKETNVENEGTHNQQELHSNNEETSGPVSENAQGEGHEKIELRTEETFAPNDKAADSVVQTEGHKQQEINDQEENGQPAVNVESGDTSVTTPVLPQVEGNEQQGLNIETEETNEEKMNVENVETESETPAIENVKKTRQEDAVISHEIEEPARKKRKVAVTVKVEWEERVLELIQYKIRKNNCNIPLKWKPNPGLADWVWRQREQYRLYRLGQPSTLTTTRIAKLTELGFEFVAPDQHGHQLFEDQSKLFTEINTEKPKFRKSKVAIQKDGPVKPTPKSRFKEGKWLQSLAKVVAYKEEMGNCNVPRKWKRDPTLGEWVHFQRRQYRLKSLDRRNHMTEERIRKLEGIGFEWSRGSPNPSTFMGPYV